MKIIRHEDDIKSGLCRGHKSRDWSAEPFGFNAKPFDLTIIKFNATEWKDRIEHRKKLGIFCRQIKSLYGIKSHNQGSTNLCWMNADIMAMERAIAKICGKFVRLSPVSAAGPMLNFRNWSGRPAFVGGWSGSANEWIREHGVNLTSEMPYEAENFLSPQQYTDDLREKALLTRVTEWMDFPSQGLSLKEKQEIMFTSIENGIAFANGRNRWSHATTTCGLDYVDGEFVWIEDNSGYGRDSNGESVLAFNWVYDDAVAPTVISPRDWSLVG